MPVIKEGMTESKDSDDSAAAQDQSQYEAQSLFAFPDQ